MLKTTPILLCALATLLPARLGLVSVGADGQLLAGDALTVEGFAKAWPRIADRTGDRVLETGMEQAHHALSLLLKGHD